MNKHIKEFDKRAFTYSKNNHIQTQISKDLTKFALKNHDRVLDIGCGEGAVYSAMEVKPSNFIGIDISKNMLSLHPKGDNISLINKNFDNMNIYEEYQNKVDIVYSSSALQWSKNLKSVLRDIYRFDNFAICLQTEGTFSNVRAFFNIDTFLHSVQDIKQISNNNSLNYMIKNYKIEFDSNQKLLTYIKQSGVSGGGKVLKVSDIQKFKNQNRKKYLNFEVLFIKNI